MTKGWYDEYLDHGQGTIITNLDGDDFSLEDYNGLLKSERQSENRMNIINKLKELIIKKESKPKQEQKKQSKGGNNKMNEKNYVVWKGPDGLGPKGAKNEATNEIIYKHIGVKLPAAAGGTRLTSARATLVSDECMDYLKTLPENTYEVLSEARVKEIEKKAEKTKEDTIKRKAAESLGAM